MSASLCGQVFLKLFTSKIDFTKRSVGKLNYKNFLHN